MNDESGENTLGGNRFAPDLEEAKARFQKFRSKDPFPDIKPALLNSADISDYVEKIGMVYPFHEKKLKAASYEVNLLGKIIYWDAQGERRSKDLARDEEFILVKNSIAFVTPEPTFLLPDYIAIRFNLKITHVHRGILLGTGPLVDPGFEGKLLIPLHNLTNNDYKFTGGEGLIWVEFTKLSENKLWALGSDQPDRLGQYVPFPDRKKYLAPETLIEKALEGQDRGSIRSSIPESIYNSEKAAKESKNAAEGSAKDAEKAAKETEDFKKSVYKYGAGGVLVLVIALVALAISVYSTIQDSRTYITNAKVHFNEVKGVLETEVQSLQDRINELEKAVDDAHKKLGEFEKKVSRIEEQKSQGIDRQSSSMLEKDQRKNVDRDIKFPSN